MKGLLLLLLLLLAGTSDAATTRYVDVDLGGDCLGTYSIASRDCSGSDGNAYTMANALVPINGGSAGDITEFRGDASPYTTPIVVTAVGTSWLNPRTIRCRSGETCTQKASGAHNFAFSASKDYYTIVDGFITDGTSIASVGDDHAQFQFGGGTSWGNYVRIQNSSCINNATSVCIFVGRFSQRNEFIGNTIHGGAFLCSGCGGGGSYSYPLYIEGDQNLIERNDIYDAPSYGIHIFSGWSDVPSGNIVRYNKVHGVCTAANSCAGILLASGPGNVAYGNLVYDVTGTGSGAVCGIGVGGINSIIYNNTISGSLYANICWGNTATGLIFKNNLSHNSPRDYYNSTTFTTTPPSGSTGSNNLGQFSHSWTSTTSTPLFTNSATKDFTTGAGSPAIDGGVASIGSLPAPLEGSFTALGNGAVPDIGCCESIPVASASAVDASTVDIQFGTAYAPISTVSTCTGFELRQPNNAGGVKTLATCTNPAGTNGLVRLTCAACLSAGGGDIDFSVTAAKFTDAIAIGNSLNQPNFAITNQAVDNNISGTTEVFTSRHFRQRTFGRATTDTIGPAWIKAEDTIGSVRSDGGMFAVFFSIDCTIADCPSVGFQFEWDLNGAASWAAITDSCATNAVCYTTTNSAAPHGAVIPASQLTDALGNYLAGAVAAQASSYPVLDLAINQSTQIQVNLAIKTGLVAGTDQVCIRPKLDSGAAITYASPGGTACFNIVAAAGSPS